MASTLLEQLKTSSTDDNIQDLLESLSKLLFASPGIPVEATFQSVDFPLILSLAEHSSNLPKVWLSNTVSDLCRRDDTYSPSSLPVLSNIISHGDPFSTREAIISACIVLPCSLDFIRKNGHDPRSSSLWSEITGIKESIIKCLNSPFVSVKLTALRFIQVTILNFSMPNPAPLFKSMTKNAEQQLRAAPVFQLNRVPAGHPVLDVDAMTQDAVNLLGLMRERLLAFIDSSASAGNISVISALVNLFSNILQFRVQFVDQIVGAISDFYQDYQDPVLRVERKSLDHTLKATMAAIGKYDIGGSTAILAQCLSGRIARGRRQNLEPSAKRGMQLPGMPGAFMGQFGMPGVFIDPRTGQPNQLMQMPFMFNQFPGPMNPMQQLQWLQQQQQQQQQQYQQQQQQQQQRGTSTSSQPTGQIPQPVQPVKKEIQITPPPSQLTISIMSESLNRIISSISMRVLKPNSNLYSSFAVVTKFVVLLPWDDPALKALSELLSTQSHTITGKGLLLMWIYSEFNSYILGKTKSKESEETEAETKDQSSKIKMEVDAENNGDNENKTNNEENNNSDAKKYGRYGEVLDIALELFGSSEFLPSIVLEMPLLTDSVFNFLAKTIRESRTADLAINALKDLIINRPPYRSRALNMLLEFTTDENDLVQSKVITHTKDLLGYKNIAEPIVEYSKNLVSMMLSDVDVIRRETELTELLPVDAEAPEEKIGQPLTAIQVSNIIRKYLNLFLGMCVDRPELLPLAVDVYSKVRSPELRGGISRSIIFRVKSIGSDHPVLLQIITQIPKNCDKLALEICEANGPTPALAKIVMAKQLDSRFIASVFPALPKSDAISVLPKMIVLPQPTLRKLINMLLTRPGMPLSPEDLLFHLHVIDTQTSGASLKDVAIAINVCFEDTSKVILKQDILSPAISRLLSVSPLPTLLLRTILLTINHSKAMIGYILSILEKPPLFDKQVWNDPKLWPGFMNCCEKLLPHTVRILLNLPLAQFQAVLEAKPTIKDAIRQRMNAGVAIPKEKQHFFVEQPRDPMADSGEDRMATH